MLDFEFARGRQEPGRCGEMRRNTGFPAEARRGRCAAKGRDQEAGDRDQQRAAHGAGAGSHPNRYRYRDRDRPMGRRRGRALRRAPAADCKSALQKNAPPRRASAGEAFQGSEARARQSASRGAVTRLMVVCVRAFAGSTKDHGRRRSRQTKDAFPGWLWLSVSVLVRSSLIPEP